MTVRRLYEDYYATKNFEREDLFQLLIEHFQVQRGLYPGSFIHITPSFAIRSMVYVDTDRRCPRFFQDPEVFHLVRARKRYDGDAEITFHHQDYRNPLDENDEAFDLLLSQWCGQPSDVCKRYLRIGGILVANDSHGDASLAYLDPDYQFVAAVIQRDGVHRLDPQALDRWFVPKSKQPVTQQGIKQRARGGKYTKTASMYLFRRVC